MATPAVRNCAVLGSPIEHSLSPVLHRAAYAELGLPWQYSAVDVEEPELPRFLRTLDASWRGLSLTMPLKRTVMPFLDDMDLWAEVSGAANTVVLADGAMSGFNTDIPGAIAALQERVPGPFTNAVVLGGGATAASMLLALGELGCEYARLLVRDPSRATQTVETVARAERGPVIEVGTLGDPVGAVDLVISTIPASAQSPALVASADPCPVVFEVVYDPWPTPLAAAALRSGRILVGGLDLLINQAARQVELMTNLPAPVAAMRAAGEGALAARVRP
ncbi:shikimate dehydrogenase [Marmoricola sp. OAE513]|uniref:shikimate dehydrogenase n=1 Tax=Marmoricola sp. OAE513 TaxID=2817894 RepID=UPI001AE26072